MSALKAASESVQAHERLVCELKNSGGDANGKRRVYLSVVAPTLLSREGRVGLIIDYIRPMDVKQRRAPIDL